MGIARHAFKKAKTPHSRSPTKPTWKSDLEGSLKMEAMREHALATWVQNSLKVVKMATNFENPLKRLQSLFSACYSPLSYPLMWNFSKSHADVWSTIVGLSKRHEEKLEADIRALIKQSTSDGKSSSRTSQPPSKALESALNHPLPTNYLVVWDIALGRAPFSSPEILSRFVSIPCVSNSTQSSIGDAHSRLHALFNLESENRALHRLIVATSASYSSLDLDLLFSALLQPISGINRSLFDSIDFIDLFLGEIPSKTPNEVRERVKRKIAPVTHTPIEAITLHPIGAIYRPISNHLFQIHCDPASNSLGIATTNASSSSNPSAPLIRQKGSENRVSMNIEYDTLARDVKERFDSLTRTFSHFGVETGYRLETWSLGPNSQLLAQQIAQSNLGADASASGEKVSLIFVDRNLDLLPPLSCGSKSLLDKHLFLQHYHQASKSSNNMDPSLESSIGDSPSIDISDDVSVFDELNEVLFKAPKEALSTLLRKLSEISAEEGLEIDFSAGAKNALHLFYSAMNGSISGRSKLYSHRRVLLLLQLASSMQEEASFGPQLSSLLSTFKHILSAPQESPLHYILDYIEAAQQVPINIILKAVISLLMLHTFVAPRIVPNDPKKQVNKETVNKKEEDQLLTKMVDLLSIRISSEKDLLKQSLPKWLHGITSDESIKQRVGNLLAYIRSEPGLDFEDFFTVQESSTEPCLLAQIVSRVFDSSNPDLRDIKLASMSLGGILKSGLSIVSLHHQPRPNDRHTVIIYVLGGITSLEAREALDMFATTDAAKQGKNRLLLASNSFITSLDLADLYYM